MLALPFLETSLDFGSMSGCDATLGQRTSPLGPGCEGRCLGEVPAVPLACGNQPCPRGRVCKVSVVEARLRVPGLLLLTNKYFHVIVFSCDGGFSPRGPFC